MAKYDDICTSGHPWTCVASFWRTHFSLDSYKQMSKNVSKRRSLPVKTILINKYTFWFNCFRSNLKLKSTNSCSYLSELKISLMRACFLLYLMGAETMLMKILSTFLFLVNRNNVNVNLIFFPFPSQQRQRCHEGRNPG